MKLAGEEIGGGLSNKIPINHYHMLSAYKVDVPVNSYAYSRFREILIYSETTCFYPNLTCLNMTYWANITIPER